MTEFGHSKLWVWDYFDIVTKFWYAGVRVLTHDCVRAHRPVFGHVDLNLGILNGWRKIILNLS